MSKSIIDKYMRIYIAGTSTQSTVLHTMYLLLENLKNIGRLYWFKTLNGLAIKRSRGKTPLQKNLYFKKNEVKCDAVSTGFARYIQTSYFLMALQ